MIGLFTVLGCAALVCLLPASQESVRVPALGVRMLNRNNLTLEDMTDKLSRNVGDTTAYAIQHLRRAKISSRLRQKPEISLHGDREVLYLLILNIASACQSVTNVGH